MEILKGQIAQSGYAIGEIFYFHKNNNNFERKEIVDVENEIIRFENACCEASVELEGVYQEALKIIGEEEAGIFQIHAMMLEDEDYRTYVSNYITENKINAEYAVFEAIKAFQEILIESGVDYIMDRVGDVADVSERVISILTGNEKNIIDLKKPIVLAADDLNPSETVALDKSKILAIVISKGSLNSHTSILARTLNIPAIVSAGEKINEKLDGLTVAVDGASGTIYLEPNESVVLKIQKLLDREKEKLSSLEKYRGLPTITKDGRKINLFANIGSIEDLELITKNDAEGVGLFRSEFIFIGKDKLPTEDEQFKIYKRIAEQLSGKKAIIRTLDAGADKKIEYLKMPDEENPAMGFRGIRYCLKNPDIFKTQLRAILRASYFGNLSIMFPLINSIDEIKQIKNLIITVMDELKKDKILFNENIETGIMIETPAAAIISNELAKEVDFFSIGTNDLVQYTLAVDRQNPNLDGCYEHCHDAVLKLIDITIKNAHDKNIWVGICGELASDLSVTKKFIRMGVDELSVVPSAVLALRKKISEI